MSQCPPGIIALIISATIFSKGQQLKQHNQPQYLQPYSQQFISSINKLSKVSMKHKAQNIDNIQAINGTRKVKETTTIFNNEYNSRHRVEQQSIARKKEKQVHQRERERERVNCQ